MTECPLCRAAVEPGVAVCPACGARLGGAPGAVGAARFHATAEFSVPELEVDPPASASGGGAAPVPRNPPWEASEAAIAADPAGACAWCGRGADQVRRLLGTPGVAICEGCVALCVDILNAELGPDWR